MNRIAPPIARRAAPAATASAKSSDGSLFRELLRARDRDSVRIPVDRGDRGRPPRSASDEGPVPPSALAAPSALVDRPSPDDGSGRPSNRETEIAALALRVVESIAVGARRPGEAMARLRLDLGGRHAVVSLEHDGEALRARIHCDDERLGRNLRDRIQTELARASIATCDVAVEP